MFVEEEIIRNFGSPQEIMSDNRTFFTTTSLVLFMKNHGIEMAHSYDVHLHVQRKSIKDGLYSEVGNYKSFLDREVWATAIHMWVFGYLGRAGPS